MPKTKLISLEYSLLASTHSPSSPCVLCMQERNECAMCMACCYVTCFLLEWRSSLHAVTAKTANLPLNLWILVFFSRWVCASNDPKENRSSIEISHYCYRVRSECTLIGKTPPNKATRQAIKDLYISCASAERRDGTRECFDINLNINCRSTARPPMHSRNSFVEPFFFRILQAIFTFCARDVLFCFHKSALSRQ